MLSKLKGRHVLVTGGTGSFGRRFATALDRISPGSISIFSRDEKKQYEMQLEYPHFRYILGDVRDADTIERAMRSVDYVFHAAALKQVPSCEVWPMEAVRTNIIGSSNVFSAAVKAGVQGVVALSTDKAVKPVNAMGMTKALMEKLVAQFHLQGHGTVFSTVRYGNVLGSRGSVVPVFRVQIEKGGPITLTDPAMTRFLLTLDEAVDLVFFALERSSGGEVFVRKAPACTVERLAQAVTQIYGGGKAIGVRKIGTRVGEKVHEVLVSEAEVGRAREEATYFVIPPERSSEGMAAGQGTMAAEYTSENTRRIEDLEELTALLRRAEIEPGN